MPLYGGGGGAGVTWPLTNTGDETFQPNSIASNTLTLHNNALAVNGVTVTGSATTAAVKQAATGTDTNIALQIDGKGTGNLQLETNGTGQVQMIAPGASGFAFIAVGSQVNGLSVTGSATGNAPAVASTGTDGNIGLQIDGKGTGKVLIGSNSTGDVILGAGGSSGFTFHGQSSQVNGVTVSAATTTNSPTIGATGTDTNVGLQIQPQANGIVYVIGGATTSPGIAFTFAGVNSGVNGATFTNAAAASSPILAATGTDSNIGLTINPKGTGTITVGAKSDTGIPLTIQGNSATQTGNLLTLLQNSGGVTAFAFSTVGNATNGMVFAAKAGTAPTITPSGNSTDIGLNISTKGNGDLTVAGGTSASIGLVTAATVLNIYARTWNFQDYATAKGVLTLTTTASTVNGVTVTAAATTAPPIIAATGTDTNIILRLQGKGTGGAAVLGTSTNDSATAGYVGELVTASLASGSATALTTTTSKTVTSVSLTAGDWDVAGVVDYVFAGTTLTDLKCGASSTNNTLGAADTFVQDPSNYVTITDTLATTIPVQSFSLSATTTVYLVAQATFSAGTTTAYGTIRARRMR